MTVLPRLLPLLLAALLLLATHAAHAQEPAGADAPAAVTITVDTSADLDSGSITKTCGFTAGVYVAATDGCTLRRALLEASARPQSDRPITIRFNLSPSDPNAGLEVAGTWTLPVERALPPLKTPSITNRNGSVTIDGATQPGGRSNGPRVIIDTNDFSLEVESANNTIRNLAFKGGGAIFLKRNADANVISSIWMGLTDDGRSISFRTPGQPARMAGGGIFISSNDNRVENSAISGAFARAVDISGGGNNLIQNNRIGTRADGTLPAVPAASLCRRALTLDAQAWYGGWGIALSGSGNRILNNRIAGLHILQSANDTPPIAIEIFGAGHLVQGNIMGLDSAGRRSGVCGQGIKVAGTGTEILDNVIVLSRAGFEDIVPTAILANDSSPLFGAITVRRNLVDSGPGSVYDFGPSIPQALRAFEPARITQIDGVTVRGGAAPGSPCAGCLIDLYRDDADGIQEALEHLGTATANAGGSFVFTLAQPLPEGSAIRTNSTVSGGSAASAANAAQAAGAQVDLPAGSSSRLSGLYAPERTIFLPIVEK